MIAASNKIFADTLKKKTTIKHVRILGTILAFEIAQGKDEYLNNISTIITQKAMKKGVYIRPLGNTVYIMPPYCIKEDELRKTYSAIEIIIDEISMGK